MLLRRNEADPTRTGALRRRAIDAVEERWARVRALIAERLEGARLPLNSAEVEQLRDDVLGDIREELDFPADADELPRWLQPRVEAAIEQGAEQGLGPEEAAEAGAAAAIARRSGERRRRVRETALESLHDTVVDAAERAAAVAGEVDNAEDAVEAAQDRASKRGASRMKVAAEDAVVRAHIAGKAAAFESRGVESVGVVEELRVVTAGDNQVCDECRALAAGGPYSVSRAEELLPAHPRCRCTIEPEG